MLVKGTPFELLASCVRPVVSVGAECKRAAGGLNQRIFQIRFCLVFLCKVFCNILSDENGARNLWLCVSKPILLFFCDVEGHKIHDFFGIVCGWRNVVSPCKRASGSDCVCVQIESLLNMIRLPSDFDARFVVLTECERSEIAKRAHSVFFDVVAANVEHSQINESPQSFVCLFADHSLLIVDSELAGKRAVEPCKRSPAVS